MSRYIMAVAPCVLAMNTGCILPVPHIKQTCGRTDGVVIDAVSHRPVHSAELVVRHPDGGEFKARTDDAGRFSFPAKHCFHWGYLFGVALNYSLPYDCGWFGHAGMTVEHADYNPAYVVPPVACPAGRVEGPELRGHRRLEPVWRFTGTPTVWGSNADWSFEQIAITPRCTTKHSDPIAMDVSGKD